MKYITKKSSATGKKLAEVEMKMNECFDVQIAMAKKYGFKKWRRGFWCVSGRFSAVIFAPNTEVDTKVWKNVNGSKNEWMPKCNTKKGKEIQKDFDTMPCVKPSELNNCVGYNETFGNIGFNRGNDKFYGITAEDLWEIKAPADCKEITTTEYNNLFQPKEEPKVAKRQRSVANVAK
jgi:hypothetical protein